MFSRIFIERPKLAMVISIVTVFIGWLCMRQIPIAEYPEIAPPTIMVIANYPGASAEEIADTLASPLEAEMNGLENLMYFSSESNNSGTYMLSIKFKAGTDTDIALVNVQNALKRAESSLPSTVVALGIDILKRNSDILGMYVFTKDNATQYDMIGLANFLRTNVKDELARIDGVSQVEIMGASEYSMRVWLDPLKMAAMNITTTEVSTAIAQQNIQAAAGAIGTEGSNNCLQLKVNARGRLKSQADFENIIVRSQNGRTVKLKDVARVELGAEYYYWSSFNNGKPMIALSLYRNSDANAIQVVDAAKKRLKELERFFPAGVHYHMGYDPTQYIRATMYEIWETLLLTLILVVAITYLFLQNWRATLIPALTIPVSIFGAFIFLYPLGFSMNLLTMFALILVIGSLVDDAIVVVENVIRIMDEEHLPPKEATIKSMQQITGAVIATTLVILAIYAPIGFYGGMVGTIYLQFSVTMCVALCFSTINALTLSPALCATILKPTKKPRFDIYKPFNWLLNGSRTIYLRMVSFLVRRALLTAVLFAVILFANYYLFNRTFSSFLPAEDKGVLFCAMELAPGATLDRTEAVTQDFYNRVKDIPGIKQVTTINGFSFFGGVGENLAIGFADLKDWSERQTPETQIDAIYAEVVKRTADLPEARVMTFQPPAIMGLGVAGGISFMLQCREGQTPKELETASNMLMMTLMQKKDLFVSCFTVFDASTPQLYLDIDREKADALGIPVNRIFSTLQSQLAATYINDFNRDGFTFKVKVQSEAQQRSTVQSIGQTLIVNNSGNMVPLSAFATVRYKVGPRVLSRFNQMMSSHFQAQTQPGVSTGEAMRYIDKWVTENLPGYNVEWTDMSYQERQNEGKIAVLMALALAFAYLFLVGQYESWTMPLSVILSVAIATLGALIGLWYFGMSLSIYAQLGLIMLIGLAGKNAILMAEFSKQDREAGQSVYDAALNGGRVRYRAVLMTAYSFVIGVFPMVIATGAGAGSRQAIGHTTFWGMVLASLFGIVFIPPLWSLFERIREFVSPRVKKEADQGNGKQM